MIKKRMFWPDAIRVISVFLVVLLHTSAKTVLSWKIASTSEWMIGNIFDSFSRISVPLFIILSGSLLLNKKESLTVFFKKRVKRILFPWFFWGIILLAFNYFAGELGNVNIFQINFKTLKVLLIENFIGGFWFMPMLVGIYLMAPVVSKLAINLTKSEYKYFFIIWIIFSSIIPTLNYIFNLNLSFILPTWIWFLGYFIGGYFIVYKLKISKKIILQSKIIFLLNFILTVFGTYLLTVVDDKFSGGLYLYNSINVVLMSFSAFIILYHFFKSAKLNTKLKTYITIISQNSLGIIFSHFMILKLFMPNTYPLISIPLISISTFLIANLIMVGLKKSKYLEKIVG